MIKLPYILLVMLTIMKYTSYTMLIGMIAALCFPTIYQISYNDEWAETATPFQIGMRDTLYPAIMFGPMVALGWVMFCAYRHVGKLERKKLNN